LIEEGGITQPGSVKVIEEEGMPIHNSNQKGNLYIKINVHIPNFSED
jgi:DnaJ-class molecular chaperone